MVSLKARFFIFMLKRQRRKEALKSAESLMAAIKARRPEEDYRPPAKVRARLDIEERTIGGYPTYIVKSKGLKATGRHVYYLHGGAYTFEIIPPHWVYIADMAEQLGACFMVPIYPLAPEHDVQAALAYVQQSYEAYEEYAGGAAIHMMGDSAGAGLALAAVQQRQAAGQSLPAGLVLVSPFVDAVLDDPIVDEIDKADPWLAPEGLRKAGRLYGGGIDPADPRVSPINGALAGLPPLHIFIGTRDILLPSSKLLADRAVNAGGQVSYHQYEGMFHCWPLLRMREGLAARAEIEDILSAENEG